MVDSVFQGTIADNEVSGGRNGIRVVHDSAMSLAPTGGISGNRIAANRANGILFETALASDVDIVKNVIDQNGLSGIHFNSSTFDGTIADNTINGIFQGNPPMAAELSRIFSVKSDGNPRAPSFTIDIDLGEAAAVTSLAIPSRPNKHASYLRSCR